MKFSHALILSLALWAVSCGEKVQVSDAYGNFEAPTITISSEANGRLVMLRVEEGESLGAGTWVGLVDTTQLHLQRKQIEARINALPKKLRTALADIQVLENQKKNLLREKNRIQRLIEKKAAVPKALDDLNGEIKVVDQRIEAIRSQTQTANSSILAEKEPMLAQMAIIEDQIEKSYLKNPVNGTVLTKLAEQHEIVGLGSPLYRIGQLDTMDLRFYVSSVQLQQAVLGQQVEILVDQGAEHFEKLKGTISWISSQAEFTPKTIQTKEDRVNLVYAVKAKVPNPEGKLKMGMPAEVNFPSTPNQQ